MSSRRSGPTATATATLVLAAGAGLLATIGARRGRAGPGEDPTADRARRGS